jgi:hypothetical protein
MRKLAIFALLISFLLGCGAPAYARHHHVNKEARAAQKRHKAHAKQVKKEARARQKSRSRTPYQ